MRAFETTFDGFLNVDTQDCLAHEDELIASELSTLEEEEEEEKKEEEEEEGEEEEKEEGGGPRQTTN